MSELKHSINLLHVVSTSHILLLFSHGEGIGNTRIPDLQNPVIQRAKESLSSQSRVPGMNLPTPPSLKVSEAHLTVLSWQKESPTLNSIPQRTCPLRLSITLEKISSTVSTFWSEKPKHLQSPLEKDWQFWIFQPPGFPRSIFYHQCQCCQTR